MGIGDKVRELREKAGITQEELADMLNVHSNTISKWETGAQEPHSKRVRELAQILGTTPSYLLGNTDNPGQLTDSAPAQPEIKTGSNDLVYERNGTRIVLPNTPETRTLFERLVLASLGKQVASAV